MNHSFNIEVAIDYNVEKAVILQNFYFWIIENKANKRNMYKGKAYTYNTSEALSELFPYFKARKIAELLRQMEADGLIESIQNKGTNRVKSYTLTDKALEYYTSVHKEKNEQSNIQNNDIPSYENTTMDNTEIQHCSITDINNTNINTDTIGSKATKQQTKKTLLEREPKNDIEKVEKAYLLNYRQLFRYGDVKTEKPVINWLQSKKLTKQVLQTYGLDTALLAVNRAMKDDFCIQKGYCLTTILSAGVLSGLINGKPSSSHVNAVQRTGVDEVTDKDLEDINF